MYAETDSGRRRNNTARIAGGSAGDQHGGEKGGDTAHSLPPSVLRGGVFTIGPETGGETGGMSPGSVYLCVFVPMLKPRTTPILKLPLSIAS